MSGTSILLPFFRLAAKNKLLKHHQMRIGFQLTGILLGAADVRGRVSSAQSPASSRSPDPPDPNLPAGQTPTLLLLMHLGHPQLAEPTQGLTRHCQAGVMVSGNCAQLEKGLTHERADPEGLRGQRLDCISSFHFCIFS